MKTIRYSPERSLRHPTVLFREMLHAIWHSRELAWRLMVRNLSALYRQTILGYFWAFIPPLVAAGTFILLREGGALNIRDTTVPYIPWVVTGTFLWQAFADAVSAPMRQVAQAKPMLAKINFPREALILAGIGETLVNFAVRLIILIPVLFSYSILPGASIVWIPFLVLQLVAMGTVLGIFLTPPAVLFQDVEKGVPLMLPFLMIVSGAVVPFPSEGLGANVAAFNPVYTVLDSARAAFLNQQIGLWEPTITITVCTFLLILLGWAVYRVTMPHLIARMPA